MSFQAGVVTGIRWAQAQENTAAAHLRGYDAGTEYGINKALELASQLKNLEQLVKALTSYKENLEKLKECPSE